jgi:hypothetical protein
MPRRQHPRRTDANTLPGELDNLAVQRDEGLLAARQVKISTEIIQQKLDAIECKQQDSERLRVFDGIPLGKPEVADAVKGSHQIVCAPCSACWRP